MSEQDELLLTDEEIQRIMGSYEVNPLFKHDREIAQAQLAKAKQHYEQKKCQFEKDGVCYALACYSDKKCGARDNEGNPIYAEQKRLDRPEFNNALEADAHNWDARELDRPDREKMETVELQPFHLHAIDKKDGHTHLTPQGAELFLALIPDIEAIEKQYYIDLDNIGGEIEEAKKQERERIQADLKPLMAEAMDISDWYFVQEYVKALKEEK